MEDLTILKQTEVINEVALYPGVMPVGIIVALILMVAAFYIKKERYNKYGIVNNSGAPIALFIAALATILLALILSMPFKKVPTGKYIYTCYVSESTDIDKVLEIYEYVSNDGNVWIFKDKEN